MYPAGDAGRDGEGDVGSAACARTGLIASGHEYVCIVGILLRGFQKRTRCDESLRGREICVGPVGEDSLPRPFGPTGGAYTAGEGGL